jgi:hypothetical protein
MTPATNTDRHVELVDPERLASGNWCHRAQKTLGQGDISASYSADRIGMGEPIRKPFTWKGGLWVCVGIRYHGGTESAQAYRLTHPQIYEGEPVTYAVKTSDGDSARADPCGFYHGMRVKHAGAEFVLSGPPVTFAPGQIAQLALF